MHGEIEKVVSEHAITIAVLANSIGDIKDYMKESVEIQREQAVLFEKFANHEEKNSSEHTHIHARMDKMEGKIEENEKAIADINKSMNTSCTIKTKEIDTKNDELREELATAIKDNFYLMIGISASMFGLFVGAVVIFYNTSLSNVVIGQANTSRIDNLEKNCIPKDK